MAGYNDGWDPHQADIGQTQFRDIAIGGLLGMAALGAIGVVSLFGEAAIVAGTAPGVAAIVPAGTVVEVGGVEMTVAEEIAFFAEGNGALSNEVARDALAAVLESGELDSMGAQNYLTMMLATEAGEAVAPALLKTFTLEGLIALHDYNEAHINIPGFLGNFVNLGGHGISRNPGVGSLPGIPGFPDFPGGGGSHPNGWQGWHLVCYTIFHTYDEEPQTVCYYEN